MAKPKMKVFQGTVGPGGAGSLLDPGGVAWLYQLERRAILPVKWLMCLLCAALVFVRSPEHLPPASEFVLLAFYFVTNVVFSYLIYLGRIAPGELRPFSIVSFAVDVFVMAGFIFLTGGIDSDFFILFFLVILRGLGFFPTARMNLLANVVIGLIYISSILLAGFDSPLVHEQEFYQKVLLVVGVVLLSWFLIEIQAEQRQHLLEINRRLYLERAYVQNLLESMTDGVVAFDADGRVTTINSAARQILQLPPEGQAASGRLEERIPVPIRQACRRLIQSGRMTTDETLEVPLPAGRSKTLRLSTRSLEHPEQEAAGVVAIFEDLSTLRRIEEQLWQSEKLASVGQLAAGVAHELGNPIGIIKSCAEYLRGHLRKASPGEEYPAPPQEELEVIASESARCQRILKELLSYSSQEAVALQEVDLNELVRRAEGLVAYNVPAERIRLEARLACGPIRVKADSNLLIQALVNILLNAIQSIEDAGRVLIRTREESVPGGSALGALVEIEDTGCGIPPAQQEHLFEPFYTTRKEGTGLGLAITQRIIHRLGGVIEVESKVGRGSCFRIRLQRAGDNDAASPGKG